jgi:hypothetical protein
MHRSGTSMLAGSLQEAGLVLGDVVTKAPHNRKGNREHRAIMFMQEDLLERNGGSWADPPETVRWGPLHEAVRDLFIAGFQEEPIWGFKDPRTLMTLDDWLDVLPHAELVGIFRHPALVARSLNERSGLSFEQGLRLWQIYNQRLLHLHEGRPFPLLEFHQDATLLQHTLQAAAQALDLPARHRALAFFEEDLRHWTSPAEVDLPADVRRLYDQLRERTISGRPQ